MGAVGGILRAVGSNDVNVVSKVKNPALQAQIDAYTSDLGGLRTDTTAGLGDYINKYLAGTKAAETQTGQEVGAIGGFYSGQMANQLAQLRAQRSAAVNTAADVAAKQAIRGVNAGSLGREGAGGSYATRLAIGATAPIRAQAAVEDANQARADLGYITQNQIGLAGQRTGLQNQLAARGLVPLQTRAQLYGQNLGLLGGVTNLDQANKFYGLKKDPNMWADIADSLDQGVLNGIAAYSSVAGGMGGGGGGGMGGKARGGDVHGPGTETSDSIPIRVSEGEYIVPAASLEIPGVHDLLEEIRRLGLRRQAAKNLVRRFTGGGLVRRYGYADGGLAGSAQQLGARVDADLAPPTLIAPVMVPVSGIGGSMVQPQAPAFQPVAAPHLGYTPQMANADFMHGYRHAATWNSGPETWNDWGDPNMNYQYTPSMDRNLAPDLNLGPDSMIA